MANNPKKVKDPTEVALSAIQEALNISDTTVDTNRNSIGGELAAAFHSVRRAALFRNAVRHARKRRATGVRCDRGAAQPPSRRQ